MVVVQSDKVTEPYLILPAATAVAWVGHLANQGPEGFVFFSNVVVAADRNARRGRHRRSRCFPRG
jgi:hypothetical protein